ncbi:MAG: signal peptidase I [Clostridia bacterium]|nr:signal peptidase I [Clostridia bacterium]
MMGSSEKVKKGKRSVIRTVLDVVGYVLIFAIVLLAVFVMVSKAQNNTLFIFGKSTAWVMTKSMEPVIPEKSYILIEKVDTNDIEAGDIIIFKSDDPALGGSYNTHRVVEVLKDHSEFVTKGDNNAIKDAYTAKSWNVLGKYVRNLPVLSVIGRFFFSSAGLVTAIVLILGIVAAMYLPGMLRSGKKKSDELEEERQREIDERVREEVERLKAENDASGIKDPPDGGDTDDNTVDKEPNNDINDQ